MAKIKINGDSSGYVEIAAPNAAPNNTLELGPGTKILTDKNTHTGNIGIGTANPSYLVDAHTSSGNAQLRLKSGGDLAQIFLESTDTSGNSQINFADAGSSNIGMLQYFHSDNHMEFTVNGSERLRITSDGAVQITGVDDQDNLLVKGGSTHFAVHQDDTDGEVSLRAQDGSGSNNSKYMTFFTNPSGSAATERLRILSGGGLTFNGDTATANALDDYEEGTFTPTYQTGLTSPSYGDTSGHYTKIGQLVTFTIRINATGTNSSSHLQVGGLPFSSNTHNEGSVSFGYTDNLNGSNGLTGHIGENGSKISMYQFSGSNFNGNTGNGISGRTLHMRGFYYTDS